MSVSRRASGSSGTGSAGESAYQVALDNGFVGTQAEWLASLVGPQGPQGPAGPPGSGGGGGGTSGILTLRTLTGNGTVANTDAGSMLVVDSTAAATVTVPTGLTANMEVSILRAGVGSVSLVAASGVTWLPNDTRDTLATQGSIAYLVHLGSNRWLRTGGLI